MSPSNANQELAINCVTYPSYTSLTSGPTPTADLFVSRLAQQPLLRHASTGWPYYVRASPSKPSSTLQSHILRFFGPPCRPTFLSWVQVLNADHAFKWDLYPRHATPLYYASSFGLTATVDALLSSSSSQPTNSRPDLNAPGSRFGGTPLHGAVLRFHVPVMRALLAAGAEGSRADYNGVSPLHTAAAHGNEEVIRLLLEYGADVKAVDKGGETPTDWARKAGQAEGWAGGSVGDVDGIGAGGGDHGGRAREYCCSCSGWGL